MPPHHHEQLIMEMKRTPVVHVQYNDKKQLPLEQSRMRANSTSILQPHKYEKSPIVSAPIKCPPSSWQSTHKYHDDYSISEYNRDTEYYDSLTWAMYHRITNARRSSLCQSGKKNTMIAMKNHQRHDEHPVLHHAPSTLKLGSGLEVGENAHSFLDPALVPCSFPSPPQEDIFPMEM